MAWRVSFQSSAFTYDDPGWIDFTLRLVIPAADLAYGGSRLRMTLLAATSQGMQIDSMYVGIRSGTYGFASAPVQVLFSGSPSVTVAAGGSIVTDEVSLSFAETDDLLVSMFFGGTSSVGGILTAPNNVYYYYTDDASTQSPSGYTAYSLNRAVVYTIEVPEEAETSLTPASGSATTSSLATAAIEATSANSASGAATASSLGVSTIEARALDPASGAATTGSPDTAAIVAADLSPAAGVGTGETLETVEGAASADVAAGVATTSALTLVAVEPEPETVVYSSIIPIQPLFVDLNRWADETVGLLYDVAAVPRLDAPGEWLPWAREVVGTPAIAAFNPPDPDHYADWRLWAVEFNEAISSRGVAA